MGLDTIVESSVQRRRLMLGLYLLMALTAAPGLWLIETDNSPRVFFLRDDDALLRYERFQGLFGRDHSLRVVAQGEGVWTRAGLTWLAGLERDARTWTGVVGAVGLYGRHRRRFPEWPPDPETLRAVATGDSLDRAVGWVSDDGRVVTTLLALSRLSPQRQRLLLEKLEAYLADAPAGVRTSLAGLPAVSRAVDSEVAGWMRTFFPLLVALAVGLLALLFRRSADVLLTLTLVGICQTVVFGAMGLAGVRLNLIMVLLGPLLFVVSLATAVHILVRYRQLAGPGKPPAGTTLATFRDKAWPTFWTGATTAAGFGSLTVAEVPPIRDFGLWSALGIGFLTLACFTLYPALLASFGARTEVSGWRFQAWSSQRAAGWAGLAVARPARVFAAFGISAVLMLWGVAGLRLDSNALHYLPAKQPARADLEALEEAGVGAVGVEVAVEAGGRTPDLERPDALRRLRRLSAELRGLPRVLGAVGAGDILAVAAEDLPEEAFPEDQRLREAIRRMREDPETRPLLGAVLTRGGGAARVTLLVNMLGYDDLEPVFDQALRLAREAFPGAEIYLTGQYFLVLEAQRSLLRTMILSLSLALLAVALAFWLLSGSLGRALLLLLPNLWPVCLVAGALVWAGFPLDSTTVMIAAVVLGLAVDDTLHALGAFRRARSASAPAAAAVEALRETAPALGLTTLILVIGFAVCGLSAFVPISRFGLITAVGLVGALAADLWLTPALLASFDRKGNG